MAQMCLHFMAVADPKCSSLIRKSTNGKYFEFAHFSVREFLEDEKAISQTTGIEKYWIARSMTNFLLARQCLRFLQMENFDKMPDEPNKQVAATRQRDNSYPFYRLPLSYGSSSQKMDSVTPKFSS
ncbi:hypothetical protein FOC4_g10006238 [Fusarium odoratissimum]|uniref:Uncharacterized protein n=1 Tax=Fusarium oxysporum f. sp. cubense (strain race 4) TaxID=2502994 RepID=N1RAX6_FUSC4|nr:hypothetical protein FOC4_g10006238 [Fusarium odoratissimum]